ncbi:multiple inositol polyphosphate phosphatase 1-like [Ctenocephalides felis]|uniref:multiple inositol polyphosphate phosphatase 1-like n=1 Tax=Ctenocephalides felis TaxID=7515 RepID=UPI000E6E37E1|nr:multiple inositol polyphosphate phosphatase 1-like [Ctenocephalides felis]
MYWLAALLLLSTCSVFAQFNRNISQCCEESCYSTDDQSQNTRFATKTAYELVKGVRGDLYRVPHCEPVQFWLLTRHGTRLPTAKEIGRMPHLESLRDEIIRNYQDRNSGLPDRGRLCFQDLENLSRWRWDYNITANHEQYLVYQGQEDLRLLARRFQSKYPQLMDSLYNPKQYEFRHTETQRTEYSFKAFAEGLFGPSSVSIHLPPPPKEDKLLKGYDFCPLYIDEEDKPKPEHEAFKNSPLYTKLVEDVSSKLGFRFALDKDVVNDIWAMCRYDRAWKLDRLGSPWCAAFTQNQVKILEYLEDLKYYYKTGYGLDINTKIGCPPIKDMIEKFTKKIDTNDGPNVVAYFTHQAMLNMMLTTLGLAKDSRPLTAADFEINENRQWRVSKQSPFTGNLAAILHKCDETQPEPYQVLFLLNEAPAEISDCRVGLCSWETVRRKWALLADTCDLNHFCLPNSAPAANLNVIGFVSLVITVLLLDRFRGI